MKFNEPIESNGQFYYNLFKSKNKDNKYDDILKGVDEKNPSVFDIFKNLKESNK